ncbi:MAG: hypothetical protein ACI3VR_00455 [Intestinibacter sp.]|uniref:hypothetical protein n=1 Tax=Intestinibacter sp. TaxID=1965304 RepID=UPI003F16AF07
MIKLIQKKKQKCHTKIKLLFNKTTLSKKQDNKKSLPSTKPPKYYSIIIIILVFIIGFLVGKLSSKPTQTDNNITENQTPIIENNVDTIENDNINTPFKVDDIVISTEEAQKTSDGYIIKCKIKNNSNTPLQDVMGTVNVNNGDTTTYFTTLGSTIMPGDSYTAECDLCSVKKIESIKPVQVDVYWSDNNHKYYSDVDLQLNTIETMIYD